MARATISEAAAAPAAAGSPGRIKVGLITPGWGSSGFYSPQVLENAATDKVWPKGTHVFFDHPGEAEMYDRPERSVRDLAAVLDEDAHVENGGLVAEASVIGPYRDLVTDPVFVEAVGMSIRAGAETTTGEAEGRKGTIITRLTEGISVDLVTRAGRGGKVLAVLESARAGAAESLTDETRTLLGLALGNGEDYVLDFDPDKGTVVYQHVTQDDENGYESETLQDGYTIGSGVAALKGKPKPVRRVVSYAPVKTPAAESGTEDVPAPAGQPAHHPTPTVQENTMGTIQVDEAEHGRLTEAAGRVPTLETERDTAVAERDTARSELATYKVREAARPAVTKRVNESSLPAGRKAKIVEAVLAGISPDKDGAVDADAIAAATEAAVVEAETEMAEIAEALGVGKITGFGAPTQSAVTEADLDKAIAGAFGRTIKEA